MVKNTEVIPSRSLNGWVCSFILFSVTWYWKISGRNVFLCLMLSADVATSCHDTSVCLLLCVSLTQGMMSTWQIAELAWVTAGYHHCPPHRPQPSCLCCLWPGACQNPLPSWHTFTGTLLSFPLTYAEPLLPALLRHPSSPINFSWSDLQLLCLSPHHQLSCPKINTSFHANTDPLLPSPKSPPLRQSRKLMLSAASAMRSCSCGPPWIGFGYCKKPPQISAGSL